MNDIKDYIYLYKLINKDLVISEEWNQTNNKK